MGMRSKLITGLAVMVFLITHVAAQESFFMDGEQQGSKPYNVILLVHPTKAYLVS